ncbi:MAG: hypothetical protein M1838_004971 [Thelocarpon superellum]|nr:MAG: hypothetical protein M1838_004971 [Thelocarpon superellum]
MSDSEDGEKEWAGDFDMLGDPEEKRVLFAALDSFSQYRQIAHHHTTHIRRQAFYALPTQHWQRLAAPPISYLATLEAVDDAIESNGAIARAILSTGLSAFDLPADPPAPGPDGAKHPLDWRGAASSNDLDKARTTIRQFYRDWSEEGRPERRACYDPVLADLCAEFPLPDGPGPNPRNATRVLVPGAGLGRLVHAICAAGFHTTGNEISHHALLASSWVLNHTLPPSATAPQHALYPFALSFSNHLSRAHQLQRVLVPDIHPGTALSASMHGRPHDIHPFDRLSMCAGDFIAVFSAEEYKDAFDAVVTVFFVDTAPNVLRYVETVRSCLKPGGVWINLGPLLWHFDPGEASSQSREKKEPDTGGGGKEKERKNEEDKEEADIGGVIELTNEEILHLISSSGFTIEKDEVLHYPLLDPITGPHPREDGEKETGGMLEPPTAAGYIANPHSMLLNVYRNSHWIARKSVSPPSCPPTPP